MVELQKHANELLPKGKVISFKSLVAVVPKVAKPSSIVGCARRLSRWSHYHCHTSEVLKKAHAQEVHLFHDP
jgi:hypothetical protein